MMEGVIKWGLYLLVFATSYPVGIWLKKVCSDEVKSWESRLKGMIVISIVLIGVILFLDFAYKVEVVLSLLYVILVNLVVLRKK